jgi:hypothetical protein
MTGSEALHKSRDDGKETTDSHSPSSAKPVGLFVAISVSHSDVKAQACSKFCQWTSEEPPSNDTTHCIHSVQESEHIAIL